VRNEQESIMRNTILLAALLAAGAGAHAESDAPSKGSNDCVFVRSIHDFRPLDREHVVIWAPGRRDAYLVELAGASSDLRLAHRLAVVDRNGDGQVCGYGMDRIIDPDSSITHSATIIGMTRLDPERIAQLEAQYNVRLTRKSDKQENKG